jgi:hypothetical protein
MGDGALVEFAGVVDAVACAVAIQAGMAERNDGSPEDRPVELRIGVHLGDIIVEAADIRDRQMSSQIGTPQCQWREPSTSGKIGTPGFPGLRKLGICLLGLAGH